MKYQNYTVMVAGATSGIGLAITKMFLEEGAQVVALGRNFSKLSDLGPNCIPCKCDVTNVDELRAACDFTKERFDGKLDVLVNSAGLPVQESVTSVDAERFDAAINLLLRPSVLLTSYMCEALSNSGSGSPVIVHISSSASRSIVPNNILYGMCKHALNLYGRQSAVALPGIRVFTISPGTFDTPIFTRDSATSFTDTQRKNFLKIMSKGIPVGRIGDPAEIGQVVSFLCSEEASFMTGCDILIDGGIMTINR